MKGDLLIANCRLVTPVGHSARGLDDAVFNKDEGILKDV